MRAACRNSVLFVLFVVSMSLELAEDFGTRVCPELGVHLALPCMRVVGGILLGMVQLVVEALLPHDTRFGVVELLGSQPACLPEAVNLLEFGSARRVLLPIAGFGNGVHLLRTVRNGMLATDVRGLAAEDDVGVLTQFAVQGLKSGV